MHKANYLNSTAYIVIYFALAGTGLYLIDFNKLYSIKSIVGQFLLALFYTQSFILTHEFGHNSFFPKKALNTVFGHFSSFISLIPFTAWRNIHRLHHKWTGWRDKDPTTEGTFVNQLKPLTKKIVNLCWATSIPLFALAYKFSIYWNLKKMSRHIPSKVNHIKKEMVIYLILYIILGYYFSNFIFKLMPSYILSLMFVEVLLISQHSHIHMPVSSNEDVSPLKCSEQHQYTRSLLLPKFISKWVLFNFNYHEAHHHHPARPCYFLYKNSEHKNAKPILSWVYNVKKIPATQFIFSTDKAKKVI